MRTSTALFGALAAFALLGACGEPMTDETLSIDMAVEAMTPTTVSTRGGEEITLVGDNFSEDVRVLVGGEEAAGLQRHGERRLTFVARPGNVGLRTIVLEGADGQRVELDTPLRYVAEQVRFADATVLLDEPVVEQLVPGDLNGDGYGDLMAVLTGGQMVPLLSAQGGGLLERGEPIGTGSTNQPIVLVADLNGDGAAEVVTRQFLWVNRGDATFEDGVSLADHASSQDDEETKSAAAGDFDGDGRVELVRISLGGVPSDDPVLTVLELDGEGQPSVVLERTKDELGGVPDLQRGLAVADVNEDGADDLLLLDRQGRRVVLFGPELSPEDAWMGPTFDAKPRDLGLFDTNLDQIPDVVVLTSDGLERSVGDGQGGFGDPERFDGGCGSYLSFMATAPHAGTNETALRCGSMISWVRWVRLGGVQPLVQAPVPGGSFYAPAVLVDLDGDGRLDLVTHEASRGLTAHYANRIHPDVPHRGLLIPPAAEPVDSQSRSRVTAGRFAGGFEAAGVFDRHVALMGAAGELPFAGPRLELDVAADFTPSQIEACDLDGDGADDLVVRYAWRLHGAERPERVVPVYVDDEGLHPGAALERPDAGSGIAVGDVNGDGRCDVIWLEASETTVTEQPTVLWRSEGRSFTAAEELVLGVDGIEHLAGADVDADGDLDLFDAVGCQADASSQHPPAELRVWRNDGTGTFALETSPLEMTVDGQDTIRDVYAARVVPNDGRPELLLSVLAGPPPAPPVLLHIGLDDGRPADHESLLLPGRQPEVHLGAGDIDGDGLQDIVIATPSDGGVLATARRELDGLEPLQVHGPFPGFLNDFVVHDLDADGLADVLYTVSANEVPRVMYVRNRSE